MKLLHDVDNFDLLQGKDKVYLPIFIFSLQRKCWAKFVLIQQISTYFNVSTISAFVSV